MQVSYENDYGDQLLVGDSRSTAPLPGDMVIIDDEEWFVIGRTFYPKQDIIVVTLSENMAKEKQQKIAPDSRLTEVSNAIIGIRNKQDKQDKKARMLSEELVSLRTYLKSTKGK